MFYLYNPSLSTYIACRSNRFLPTTNFLNAYKFNTYNAAQNVLDNNNINKNVPGREDYIIMDSKKPQTLMIQKANANIGIKFSFDELEKEIKENDRKIKTCTTYFSNIYTSVKKMNTILSLIDNKIILIYHYIEGDYCKTDEEKIKIERLLNKVLVLRRKVKKQIEIYNFMKNNELLDKIKAISKKTEPFSYWRYDSIEDFIKIIEEGVDIIK